VRTRSKITGTLAASIFLEFQYYLHDTKLGLFCLCQRTPLIDRKTLEYNILYPEDFSTDPSSATVNVYNLF
jgi:hypothetical protein